MLRKIKQSMTGWWRRNVVADDPNPAYSEFDRMDGLTPLVDADLLRAALSDGDNPALRAEVFITPTGGLVHGDLGGAR